MSTENTHSPEKSLMNQHVKDIKFNDTNKFNVTESFKLNLTKESILAKVNSYEILNHYLKPYHNFDRLLAAKNISNPFLADKQETPSFNIFPSMGSGEWRYKDFATGDDGSCFDLVMKLQNKSFPEALVAINNDMNLFIENISPANNILKKSVEESKSFSITKRPFTQKELDFWAKFKIDSDTLNMYNVSALAKFNTINKYGKPYEVVSSEIKFIFAYENEAWTKLYKPLDEKKYKFQYLGKKDLGFMFGWEQLPPEGEIVFITGGEKDVLSLKAQGYDPFTLNSETATLNKETATELKRRFKKIVVLYDNDETGLKQSQILAETHGFYRVVLPEIANNGKDISDYFSNGATKEEFETLLNSFLDTVAPEQLNTEKTIFNAVELMAMGNLEPKYLMEPILPQKGSAVLAGKPDTGKSQLVRQLCIQIALGRKDFIGFKINPVYNKAVYVTTEDNSEATRYLLNKQITGLGEEVNENLRFMFADTMEQEEILMELDKALTEEPVDLVVIDSFGDIFKGGDSNNNMAMRNNVKIFDKIAKKHNCLILFVHHINKGAYRIAPGQEHIQGGAGLVQKVRLAIQLSEGEGNTRYFTVVKGNYCPKEYKQNSLELDFSEETFLFTNTGRMVPTDELGTYPIIAKKEEKKYTQLQEAAKIILGDKILSYGSIVKQYCDLKDKAEATGKRAVNSLSDLGIIEKCDGGYRLSENNFSNTDENDLDLDNDIEF